jgi:hypothetical protein
LSFRSEAEESAVAVAFAVAVAVAFPVAVAFVAVAVSVTLLSLPFCLSFRNEAKESAVVVVAAGALQLQLFAVVCSCCHPERSEGPRSPPLTHTARTFQPTTSTVPVPPAKKPLRFLSSPRPTKPKPYLPNHRGAPVSPTSYNEERKKSPENIQGFFFSINAKRKSHPKLFAMNTLQKRYRPNAFCIKTLHKIAGEEGRYPAKVPIPSTRSQRSRHLQSTRNL